VFQPEEQQSQQEQQLLPQQQAGRPRVTRVPKQQAPVVRTGAIADPGQAAQLASRQAAASQAPRQAPVDPVLLSRFARYAGSFQQIATDGWTSSSSISARQQPQQQQQHEAQTAAAEAAVGKQRSDAGRPQLQPQPQPQQGWWPRKATTRDLLELFGVSEEKQAGRGPLPPQVRARQEHCMPAATLCQVVCAV
jgi:hypothetical protein